MSGPIQNVYFTNPIVNSQIATLNSEVDTIYTQDALGKLQFLHGVASGDPSATTMVISTCLTYVSPVPSVINVRYVVGTSLTGSFEDPTSEPADLVQSDISTTNNALDYTVKIRLTGLTANTTYYYKFYAYVPGATDTPNQQYLLNNRTLINNEYAAAIYTKSPVGRFKTFPASGSSPTSMKVASVNCQNINNAWFNHAYQMAEAAKAGYLDYCIYIGDAIYATWGLSRIVQAGSFSSRKPYFDENGIAINAETYEEYCQAHRSYKMDPDLQEMYRSLSLIIVYNDHEVRNDYYIDPTNKDKIILADGAYNYNRDGDAFTTSIIQNGTVPSTGSLPALDQNEGLLTRALRAWYDHLPMWGTGTFAGRSGTVNFSSTTGYTPLDRTYKIGDLLSIHIVDDVVTNVAAENQLNPLYENMIPYNIYNLPNSTGAEGATGTIPLQSLYSSKYNFGENTGAFVADCKEVLKWQQTMLGEREAIPQSQINNLVTAMSGANTAWNIVMVSYRKNSFMMGPITDGYIPPSFLTDYKTGAYNATTNRSIVPYIMSTFPYQNSSNGYPLSTYGSETLPYIALAQSQLYAEAETDYAYNQTSDSAAYSSWKTRKALADALSTFKNTVVISGDQHDNFIGHMHTTDFINNVIAGRRSNGGTGYWLNYQTSTGSIDISTTPIVGTMFTPMSNTNIFAAAYSQSWQDIATNNAVSDFMRNQWPGFVEWNNISLLNSRGFSTLTFTQDEATIKNIFVGGFSTGLATGAGAQTIREITDTYRVPNNIFQGRSGRQDVLQLAGQYTIPKNTTSNPGNQPLIINKSTVPRWTNYLPDDYAYYQPVNLTPGNDYYSYNTDINVSQI